MAKRKEREKNPHAVALGKLGGSKGGRARAEALSPKRRTEISREAANTRWARVKAAEKKEATAKRKAAKVRKARTAARHAEAAAAGKVKRSKRSSKKVTQLDRADEVVKRAAKKSTAARARMAAKKTAKVTKRKPIKTRGPIKTKAPARKVTKKKGAARVPGPGHFESGLPVRRKKAPAKKKATKRSSKQ
jgi:hypothetical protein